jgi:hypothetical protein
VFPRESEAWLRLLRQLRREVFAEATREHVDLVVSGVYRGSPDAAEAWSEMLRPVREGGGRVHVVQLTCAPEELFQRLQSESRRASWRSPARADL